MKTSAAILMFALLSSAAGASLADVHVYVNCSDKDAKCPPPPTRVSARNQHVIIRFIGRAA